MDGKGVEVNPARPAPASLRTRTLWFARRIGVTCALGIITLVYTASVKCSVGDTAGAATVALPAISGTQRQACVSKGIVGDDRRVSEEARSHLGREAVDNSFAHALWHNQDTAIHSWPAFERIADELTKELELKYEFRQLPLGQLVAHAREYRKSFWAAGGDLSPSSYKDIYCAQILLEAAYARAPNNICVGRELVETLQSASPLWLFSDPSSQAVTWNMKLINSLRNILAGELRAVKAQIEEGRPATAQDALIAIDLASVLDAGQREDRLIGEADNVLQWLMNVVRTNAWTALEANIAEWRRALERRDGFALGLNLTTTCDLLLTLRCGRRTPSFIGPRTPSNEFSVLLGGITHASEQGAIDDYGSSVR